jgi:hypothetical protein
LCIKIINEELRSVEILVQRNKLGVSKSYKNYELSSDIFMIVIIAVPV